MLLSLSNTFVMTYAIEDFLIGSLFATRGKGMIGTT